MWCAGDLAGFVLSRAVQMPRDGFQTSEDFRITWEAYLRHTPGDL